MTSPSSVVDEIIEVRVSADDRATARLVLAWLRGNPDVLGTVSAVYIEGAKGNTAPFRDFAGVVWNSINTSSGGSLEDWGIEPTDESRWISTLALVIGAWGAYEMRQR